MTSESYSTNRSKFNIQFEARENAHHQEAESRRQREGRGPRSQCGERDMAGGAEA